MLCSFKESLIFPSPCDVTLKHAIFGSHDNVQNRRNFAEYFYFSLAHQKEPDCIGLALKSILRKFA
jgi:hypothetical protein